MLPPLPKALRRGISPVALTVIATVCGWSGIYLMWHQDPVGLFLALLTTVLAWAGFMQAKVVADRQAQSLRHALRGAAARNRELERLRQLAVGLRPIGWWE